MKQQTVEFKITKEDLLFYETDAGEWLHEEGDFMAMIGTNSDRVTQLKFTLE